MDSSRAEDTRRSTLIGGRKARAGEQHIAKDEEDRKDPLTPIREFDEGSSIHMICSRHADVHPCVCAGNCIKRDS